MVEAICNLGESENIAFVADAAGSVTACVETDQDCSLFPGFRLCRKEEVARYEAGRLTPLLNKRRFSTEDIEAAYDLVEAGALGKVIINI